MMRFTPHAATPDGAALTIWHERPQPHAEAGRSSRLHIRRTEGTNGALTAAGFVAVVEAISAYLSGLTDTARDEIAARLPGSLAVSATRTEVVAPAAPGDADRLAAALADVLTAAGNVEDPTS